MINGRYALAIPAEHPSYGGHFPARPVVPAALLLQWLQKVLEDNAPGRQLVRIDRMKFLAVVEPSDQLEVDCQGQPGGTVKLDVVRGESLVCRGSVQVRESGK